jgi:hypothetical protein
MKLTPERIFRAGFFYGGLTRNEREWFNILGESSVTKTILQAKESKEFGEFARKYPDLVDELNETVTMMFGERQSKKRKRS